MSDLKIHRYRDRVTLIPFSPKGVEWVRQQLENTAIVDTFSISIEFFDESFLEALRAEGLTYEY